MSASMQGRAEESAVDPPVPSIPASSTAFGAVLGNSSIHAVGVLPGYVWARQSSQVASGPSMLINICRSMEAWPSPVSINLPEIGFSINSHIGRMIPYGSGGPVAINMVVMPALPPTNAFLTTSVTFSHPIRLGMLEAAVIKPFMIGNVVNTETVDSVLMPVLQYTDDAVAPLLAAAFTASPIQYDNMAIYAKLWYAALIDYAITTHNLDVTKDVPPWNNMPTNIFLKGNNPGEMALALHDAILAGRFIFVEGHNIFTFDLPIIYYLAAEGNIFAPGGGPGPYIPGQTVLWPAFRISVLWTTQAPVSTPQPTRPHWESVRNFIYRLAGSRGERDDCVRGFHFASDIVGSSSVIYRTPEHHNCQVLVTPLHEAFGRIEVPQPSDFNVLMRLLNFQPAISSPDNNAEYHMLGINFECVFKSVIVTSAIVSAMTTTVFSSFNFNGTLLQRYVCNLEILPTLPGVLGMLPFLHNESHDLVSLPVLFRLTFALMLDCCGFTRPLDYLATRSWGQLSLELLATQNPQDYGLAYGNLFKPFMLGNILAINRWLELRPLEWGVALPSPKCTLSTSLVLRGPPENRGWAAYLGDSAYAERFSSRDPYRLTAFAAFAINVLCQHFQLAHAPALQWQLADTNHTPTLMFGFPADFEPQPLYEASLSTFWPCTLPSFHTEKRSLISMRVALNEFSVHQAGLYHLTSCNETYIPNTGLFLPDLEYTFSPNYVFQRRGILSRRRAAVPQSSSTMNDLTRLSAIARSRLNYSSSM